MNQNLFEESINLLEEMMNDSSLPRNVRKVAQDSKERLKKENESLDLRCATVISSLDDLTDDPNVPPHGRALVYTIISKLESLSKM